MLLCSKSVHCRQKHIDGDIIELKESVHPMVR